MYNIPQVPTNKKKGMANGGNPPPLLPTPPNPCNPPNGLLNPPNGSEQMTQFANHSIVNGKHPVTVLQEACLRRKWRQPVYSMVSEDGPSHKPHFLMKCTLNDVDYIPSFSSPNKKLAKAIAAIVCLQAFGLIDFTAS